MNTKTLLSRHALPFLAAWALLGAGCAPPSTDTAEPDEPAGLLDVAHGRRDAARDDDLAQLQLTEPGIDVAPGDGP